METAAAMFRAMSTPSLGVTGVLAALWACAATVGGVTAPSARALDPALPGSIASMWGTFQLAAVVLLGVAAAAPRTLILGPALLLLGEAGDLHLLLAEALGGQGAAPHVWAKSAMAAALALLAAVPLLRVAGSRPGIGTIIAYFALGWSALALDAAQRAPGWQEPLVASLEEWCEVAMESLLVAASLAALGESLVLRRSDRNFA